MAQTFLDGEGDSSSRGSQYREKGRRRDACQTEQGNRQQNQTGDFHTVDDKRVKHTVDGRTVQGSSCKNQYDFDHHQTDDQGRRDLNQAAQAAKTAEQAPAEAKAAAPVQTQSFDTMDTVPETSETSVEENFEGEEDLDAPEDDNHDGLGFDIF